MSWSRGCIKWFSKTLILPLQPLTKNEGEQNISGKCWKDCSAIKNNHPEGYKLLRLVSVFALENQCGEEVGKDEGVVSDGNGRRGVSMDANNGGITAVGIQSDSNDSSACNNITNRSNFTSIKQPLVPQNSTLINDRISSGGEWSCKLACVQIKMEGNVNMLLLE